jgi:hypothetical protein
MDDGRLCECLEGRWIYFTNRIGAKLERNQFHLGIQNRLDRPRSIIQICKGTLLTNTPLKPKGAAPGRERDGEKLAG